MVITCFSLQARAVLSLFTILEPLGWKGLVEVTTRQMCEPPASEGDSHCPRHPCPPHPISLSSPTAAWGFLYRSTDCGFLKVLEQKQLPDPRSQRSNIFISYDTMRLKEFTLSRYMGGYLKAF